MNLHKISNVDLRGTWLPETYPHRRFSVDEESISPVSRSRTTDNASKSVVVLILLPYAFYTSSRRLCSSGMIFLAILAIINYVSILAGHIHPTYMAKLVIRPIKDKFITVHFENNY